MCRLSNQADGVGRVSFLAGTAETAVLPNTAVAVRRTLFASDDRGSSLRSQPPANDRRFAARRQKRRQTAALHMRCSALLLAVSGLHFAGPKTGPQGYLGCGLCGHVFTSLDQNLAHEATSARRESSGEVEKSVRNLLGIKGCRKN